MHLACFVGGESKRIERGRIPSQEACQAAQEIRAEAEQDRLEEILAENSIQSGGSATTS